MQYKMCYLKHMVSRLLQRLKFYVFFKKHIGNPLSGKKYKNIDPFFAYETLCNNIPSLDDEKRGLLSF